MCAVGLEATVAEGSEVLQTGRGHARLVIDGGAETPSPAPPLRLSFLFNVSVGFVGVGSSGRTKALWGLVAYATSS